MYVNLVHGCFFLSNMTKLWNNFSVVLSDNNIDLVHETKYLQVIINSSMKTTSDAIRQSRNFYSQANILLRNFRYCTNDVKFMLFKSFCINMYCCPLWFNSTSSSIKSYKLVTTVLTATYY